MAIFDISYLTSDSIQEGVGSSQILPLVIKLAERGLKVNLLTFEKDAPRVETQELLGRFGITWNPLEFGSHGAFHRIHRMLKIYKQLPDAQIFHARSDIPAFAALISKQASLLWDVRGLWSDQKAFTEHSVLKRKIIRLPRFLRNTQHITLKLFQLLQEISYPNF